jgi:hypothetical protein
VRIADIIDRITKRQEETAREALARPAARDAFAYGHASGIHQGLQMALSCIEDAMREDAEKRDNL